MTLPDQQATTPAPSAAAPAAAPAAPAAAPQSSAPAAPTSLLDAPQGSTEGATEEGGSLLDQTSKEAKPGEQKPEAAKAEAEKPKTEGAPEQYTDFTVAEGVEADPAVLQSFKEIAKGLNLTQEQAQKLVDFQSQAAKSQTEAAQNQWKQANEAWKAETIQALGANYKQELSKAAKALDTFGTPELRQVLNETGAGNRKEVVAFLVKLEKLISEDSFSEGKTSPSASPKSTAAVMYPNHPSI